MPAFAGVSHVDLTVRDADLSAAWYERVLCLVKVAEHSADEHTPRRVVNVMHQPSGFTIGFNRHTSGIDGEFSELRVGLDHLSLAVASREELESWVEHLNACGVSHSGISDHVYSGLGDLQWSTSVLVFRDPDNIQLELMALIA
ncbi:MAG: VOC family protein [Acidimicrobiales bacterium]